MIHELRIYHCLPGRLPALLKRFETVTLDLWKKHGIRQAGQSRNWRPETLCSARLRREHPAHSKLTSVTNGESRRVLASAVGWSCFWMTCALLPAV